VRLRFAGLWRHPDFLKLWAGQTVSVFGSLITGIAFQFTAILVLDASAFQVAVLGAANPVAGLVAGLVAGVWVDRLARRPLMIAADLARAALLVSVPAAALAGLLRIEQLYLVAFLTGVCTIVFDIAYQSHLPTLVRREDLVEGNSKLAASASAAEVGGFGLSGWLVQLLTAPFAVLVDAVTFVVSAVCLALIRTPEPPAVPAHERRSMRTEVVDGLRVLLHQPVLRALAASAAIEALARGVIGALILLYLSRELGFGPGVLGMIFGIGGLSSLAGAVIAGPVTRRIGIGTAAMLSLVVAAVGTSTILFARDTSMLAVVLLVANQLITDPAATVNDIATTSLRQSLTPDRVLGRVNASIRFCSLTITLIGTLAAGLLAAQIGLRPTLAIGVGCIALAAVPLLPVRNRTPRPPPLRGKGESYPAMVE
jgi:MFS family permease